MAFLFGTWFVFSSVPETMAFLLNYLCHYFINKTVLLKRKEPSLMGFLMILILLNDRLYTVPFLEHQLLSIFKRLCLLLQSSSWYKE